MLLIGPLLSNSSTNLGHCPKDSSCRCPGNTDRLCLSIFITNVNPEFSWSVGEYIFTMNTYDFMRQRFEDAWAHDLVKKTGTMLFHMLLAALALVMTVMICGYIIYTINFIVPPYFYFMYNHGPFSFLILLFVWAIVLFRFLTLSPEDPVSFKWAISMYALSTFLIVTGVGAFVVLPFVQHRL